MTFPLGGVEGDEVTGAEAKLTDSYQVLPTVLLNLPPLLLPGLALPHPEEVFWNPKALTPHTGITSVPPSTS